MRNKMKEPTQRQLRVGEEIRHILAKAFTHATSGSELLNSQPLTVTEVKVSPDLRHAVVFVMPLGGKDTHVVLKELKENVGFFRSEVARKLAMKATPKLIFREDASFDEAQKIEKLLRNPKVKSDL